MLVHIYGSRVMLIYIEKNMRIARFPAETFDYLHCGTAVAVAAGAFMNIIFIEIQLSFLFI